MPMVRYFSLPHRHVRILGNEKSIAVFYYADNASSCSIRDESLTMLLQPHIPEL